MIQADKACSIESITTATIDVIINTIKILLIIFPNVLVSSIFIILDAIVKK